MKELFSVFCSIVNRYRMMLGNSCACFESVGMLLHYFYAAGLTFSVSMEKFRLNLAEFKQKNARFHMSQRLSFYFLEKYACIFLLLTYICWFYNS